MLISHKKKLPYAPFKMVYFQNFSNLTIYTLLHNWEKFQPLNSKKQE